MRKFQSITVRNERQFRAFTGLPEKAFDRLLPDFTRCLEAIKKQRYQKQRGQRERQPGGGRKGALSTPELKLFFILFYLKNYPTFDVLGGLFNLSPGKAEENVMKLLPLLKQAEKCLQVLPHRHFKPLSNDKQATEKNQKIIIDATERPCYRPHHARKQKHYYSGKKHHHTLKNTVIADGNKGIPVVGPMAPGSRHDYALLKEELDPHQPGLSSVEVSVDLGYQGIKDRYPTFHEIHIPHKKPKKSKKNPNPTLTPQQKRENRAISRVRVAVEHLIGDLKSFQILTIKFRNRVKNMADQVILLVAGLCNLKNDYVVQ
ncbi:MAG: transposase family protein [Candidatus Contendobacter sp.]